MAPSPREVQQRWRTCAWSVYVFLLSGYLIYCGFLIQKAYGLSKNPLVATFTDIKRTIKLPYVAVCLNEQDFLSDCGPGQYEIGRVISRCLVRNWLEQPPNSSLPQFGANGEEDNPLPLQWYRSPVFNQSATLINLGKSNPGVSFLFRSPESGDTVSNCKAEPMPTVKGFEQSGAGLFCFGYDLEGFKSAQPSQLNQGATIDLFLGLADSNYPATFFGEDPTRSPNRRARTPSTYCRNRQSSAGFCGPSCDSVQVLLAENKAAIEENLVARGVGTYRALANQTGLVPFEITYRQPFTSSDERAFYKPAEISVLTGDQQRINLCNAESAQCAGAGVDVYYLVTDLDYYILRLRLSGPNLGVAIQQEQNPWLSLLSTLGGAWFLIPFVFGMLFVSVESKTSERFQLVNARWMKDHVVTPITQLFVKCCSIRIRKPPRQFDDMDLQLRAMEHDGRGESSKDLGPCS